jgi:hypothetical protein
MAAPPPDNRAPRAINRAPKCTADTIKRIRLEAARRRYRKIGNSRRRRRRWRKPGVNNSYIISIILFWALTHRLFGFISSSIWLIRVCRRERCVGPQQRGSRAVKYSRAALLPSGRTQWGPARD